MDSNDIVVIQDTGQAHEGDHLSVHTYPSPINASERIAIVDASQWFDGTSDAPLGGMTVTKLIDMQPCTHDNAMRTAQEYAMQHGIKRIYEQKDR